MHSHYSYIFLQNEVLTFFKKACALWVITGLEVCQTYLKQKKNCKKFVFQIEENKIFFGFENLYSSNIKGLTDWNKHQRAKIPSPENLHYLFCKFFSKNLRVNSKVL